MKLLIACLLSILGTSAGTVLFVGTMKNACQTGFLVAAGITVALLLMGRLD